MSQKYASYNQSGAIIAFYDSVDSPAPKFGDVIPITDSEWQQCSSETGWTVQSGKLTAPAAPTAAQLLAQAQTTQIAMLSAGCQAAIYKGFVSNALGAAYTYPTDDKSQFNLAASVTDSLLPNLPANWTTPFMCADSSGVWAMRPHTAAQIQQAGSDGKAFVLKNLQQNASLAAQVTASATVATVQTIVWTNPA